MYAFQTPDNDKRSSVSLPVPYYHKFMVWVAALRVTVCYLWRFRLRFSCFLFSLQKMIPLGTALAFVHANHCVIIWSYPYMLRCSSLIVYSHKTFVEISLTVFEMTEFLDYPNQLLTSHNYHKLIVFKYSSYKNSFDNSFEGSKSMNVVAPIPCLDDQINNTQKPKVIAWTPVWTLITTRWSDFPFTSEGTKTT